MNLFGAQSSCPNSGCFCRSLCLKRARALELGCREAKGEFIAILDADDHAYPERLAKQVAFFEAHPDHVWLGTAEERVDSQRGEHVVRQYPLDDRGMRRMASKCVVLPRPWSPRNCTA